MDSNTSTYNANIICEFAQRTVNSAKLRLGESNDLDFRNADYWSTGPKTAWFLIVETEICFLNDGRSCWHFMLCTIISKFLSSQDSPGVPRNWLHKLKTKGRKKYHGKRMAEGQSHNRSATIMNFELKKLSLDKVCDAFLKDSKFSPTQTLSRRFKISRG